MLRVVRRFQQVAGFDRSMALASVALAAMIPLVILCGTLLEHLGLTDLADHVVKRYGLTGGGAAAVEDVLSPATATEAGMDGLSAVFLVISLLSFSRATQRLFEQVWELGPLSVRNTLNGLRWILGLLAYLAATGWLYATLDSRRYDLEALLVTTPVTGVFLIWSGRTLSARRITRPALLPFGVIAAAVTALYSAATAVYLPRLFNAYAERYGSAGAVFATLSSLFGAMVVVVGSAALGREVHDELLRIRRGERPPDDEVRREWRELVDEVRSRWRGTLQTRPRRRSGRKPRRPGQ